MQSKGEVFDTGDASVNLILRVLLSSNMIIGGFMGFLLDNTIPGRYRISYRYTPGTFSWQLLLIIT